MKTILSISFMLTCVNSVSCYNTLVPTNTLNKKKVYFFPAAFKSNVPHELYHTFLDNLNINYDVEIADKTTQHDIMNNENEEVLLLSHSSGAGQLMNVYEQLPYEVSKKAVLIDPLNFKKFTFTMNDMIPGIPTIPRKFEIDLDKIDSNLKSVFEKDYIEEFKQSFFNDDNEYNHITDNHILLLNHKRSSEWRLFPVIPPIDFLKMDFKDVLENTTIIQKDIDQYSHFDILDRPWANVMNRFTMSSSKKDTTSDTESYYKQIMPTIQHFYNNN